MKSPINGIVNMVRGDAVVAGYGVVSGTIRKAVAKVFKAKDVGDVGVNAASMAAGFGLSHVKNPHAQVIGSALRISSIASVGNKVVSKAISLITGSSDDTNKQKTDSKENL